MHMEKLSVSLSPILCHFIKEYQTVHACKSKSEVIQKALKLLRQKELEQHYRNATSEIDPLFDTTANDGLEDETW